jgi:CheY-like chemotaxis protein
VPIIAVTALSMAGDRERCLAAGMDDYLTKPIDRELLRSKLVYWMHPSSVAAAKSPNKVIHIFDSPFTASPDVQEDPLNIAALQDAYGDETPDLLQLFSTSSERMILQLKEQMEVENCREIAGLAHELKGASWAVGADELARLAVFLEQAAVQENWRLIHRTFVRLCHHFFEIRKFLDTQGFAPTESAGQAVDKSPTKA